MMIHDVEKEAYHDGCGWLDGCDKSVVSYVYCISFQEANKSLGNFIYTHLPITSVRLEVHLTSFDISASGRTSDMPDLFYMKMKISLICLLKERNRRAYDNTC